MTSLNEKSILVTGGKGMVGRQVSFGVQLGRKDLDILNPASIERALDRYQPSHVFHLAALTDMMACEKMPEYAYRVNVIGTHCLAQSCQQRNIRLIYLSTCAVFDGEKKTPYDETDHPHPLNVYGRTKWIGELVIQDLVRNFLIVRTGWLFGGGLGLDKKFVGISFEKFKRNELVKATQDRYGSPTYVPDLLAQVLQLIKNGHRGLIHIVNQNKASYFEIAKVMKKLGRFSSEIKPVKAKEVESTELKRGKLEALTSKIVCLRSWQKALDEYLKSIRGYCP